MSLKNQDPSKTVAWDQLKSDYKRLKKAEMKTLFSDDPQRKERFTIELNQLTLDFSKNL